MVASALRTAVERFWMLRPTASQAKRDVPVCLGSRGNALSRGPLPSFLRSRKRGHKALTLHGESLLVVR